MCFNVFQVRSLKKFKVILILDYEVVILSKSYILFTFKLSVII